MFSSRVLILTLAIAANSFGPVLSGNGEGSPKCTPENSALKYKIGKSYLYEYSSKGEVDTGTNFEVKANVILTAVAACDFVLTVEDGTISSRTGQNKGDIKLPKSTIEFFMYNGTQINLFENPKSKEDPITSNIQRAILSMLQNPIFNLEKKTVDGLDYYPYEMEETIFGNCHTYPHKGSSNIYEKTIILQECDAEGSDLIFQGEPYEIEGVVNKNIFPLRSDVTCQQTLEDGIISKAECSEVEYPHPRGFIDIAMSSSLVYKSTKDKTISEKELEKNSRASSMTYNFDKPIPTPKMQAAAREKILKLLKTLKADNSHNASSVDNTAEIFIELKKLIRRVSVTDLTSFNNPSILGDKIQAKLFYDAVAEVTTDATIELLSKLAMKADGTLDTTTLITFFTNIAFATKPGTKALKAMKELVSQISISAPSGSDPEVMENYKKNVSLAQLLILGSSGLAYRFCHHVRKTPESCTKVPEYVALVDAIATLVKDDSTDDIYRAAMHALGNLEELTEMAVKKIAGVLKRDNSSAKWRLILALDAFRRDWLKAELCNATSDILADKKQTDEIRILAYLALTGCYNLPDETVFSKIFEEESKIVGSFIASHARSLSSSDSPHNIADVQNFKHWRASEIVKLVPDSVMVHLNPRDPKFMEHAYFSRESNLGVSSESTVIFSAGNIKPQFFSWSGTVFLYGKAFNLIEVGLSQRLLPTTKIYYPEDAHPDYWSLMKAFSAPDTYYRVLGTTIGFGVHDMHKTMQMAISQMTTAKSGNGMTIDALIPQTLLDEELTYPTITGLPLSFNLQAVHLQSMKIEMSGIPEFSAIMLNYGSSKFDMKIKILADTASAVKGTVGIGAHTPSHIGKFAQGTVDDVQNFELEAVKKENHALHMKLNFPKTIISRKSVKGETTLFAELDGNFIKASQTENGDAGENAMATSESRKECSDGHNIFGLKACSISRRRANSNSPFEFDVTIEKSDLKMEGYDFKVNMKDHFYEVVATTPGSAIKRELKAKVGHAKGSEGSKAWKSTDVEFEAKFEGDKYFSHTKLMQNTTRGNSGYWDWDYHFVSEFSSPGNSQLMKLIDFKTHRSPEEFNMTLRMAEPLKSAFGDIDVYKTKKEQTKDAKTTKTFSVGVHVRDAVNFFRMVRNGESNDNNDVAYPFVNPRYNITIQLDTTLQHEKYKCEHDSSCFILLNKETEVKAQYSEKSVIMYEVDVKSTLNQETVFKANTTTTLTLPRNHTIKFEATIETLKPVRDSNKRATQCLLKLSPIVKLGLYERGTQVAGGKFAITNDSIEIDGMIGQLAKFSSNVTIASGQHQHAHLNIDFSSMDMTLDADIDVQDDGDKFEEKFKSVLNMKRQKQIQTTETHVLLDRGQRSLGVASNTKNNDKVLSKLDFSAKWAQDVWNGLSTANMKLEGSQGEVYKGSAEETTTHKDKIFKSNFVFGFDAPEKPKYLQFTWDLVADNNIKNPSEHDMESYVSSDKKLKIEKFDFELAKEVSWYKVKGKEEFHGSSSTNLTSSGELIQQSEVQGSLIGNPIAENGRLAVTGFSQDKYIRNDFDGAISYAGKLSKLRTENVTLSVDQTDLSEGTTTRLNDISVNSTSHFSGFKDFEFTQVGRATVRNSKTYNWAHVFKYHNDEFIYY